MMEFRPTLQLDDADILQARDRADEAAFEEFAAIYTRIREERAQNHGYKVPAKTQLVLLRILVNELKDYHVSTVSDDLIPYW